MTICNWTYYPKAKVTLWPHHMSPSKGRVCCNLNVLYSHFLRHCQYSNSTYVGIRWYLLSCMYVTLLKYPSNCRYSWISSNGNVVTVRRNQQYISYVSCGNGYNVLTYPVTMYCNIVLTYPVAMAMLFSTVWGWTRKLRAPITSISSTSSPEVGT